MSYIHAVKKPRLRHALTTLAILGGVACSDSSEISNFNTPRLGSLVERPLVFDGKLYEFTPSHIRSGEDSDGILDEIETEGDTIDHLVYLDTDPYDDQEIDANGRQESFLYKVVGPEYIGYSSDNKLYVLDMSTRHSSLLLDFNSFVNPNGKEVICDIQSFLTLDPPNIRATRDTPVIHAEQINVQAVSLEDYTLNQSDCDNVDLSLKRHYSFEFVESLTRTYVVTLETDEGQSIERLPELEAGKRVISPALMYAGSPFVDSTRNEFAYLGINSELNTLELWSSSVDSPKLEIPRWSVDIIETDLINTNSNRQKITAPVDNFDRFTAPYVKEFIREPDSLGEKVHFTLGGDIVGIFRDTLFSNNRLDTLEQNLNSPLYEHDPTGSPVSIADAIRCSGDTAIHTFEDTLHSGGLFDYALSNAQDAEGIQLICGIFSDSSFSFLSSRLTTNPNEDNYLEDVYMSEESVYLLKRQNSGTASNPPPSRSVTQIPFAPPSIEQTLVSTLNNLVSNVTSNLATNFFDEETNTLTSRLRTDVTLVDSAALTYQELRSFPNASLEAKNIDVVFNGTETLVTDFNNETRRLVINASANCRPDIGFEFVGCPFNETISTLDYGLIPSSKNKMQAITNDFGIASLMVATVDEDNLITEEFLGLFYFDPINIDIELEDGEEPPEHVIRPMEVICILEDGNGARLDTSDSRSCYGR